MNVSLGLQLPNVRSPLTIADREAIAIIKPAWVRCLADVDLFSIAYCRMVNPGVRVVVRPVANGRITPDLVPRDVRAVVNYCRTERINVIINVWNEPNHPTAYGADVQQAAIDLQQAINLTRQAYPSVPLCAPNLTVDFSTDRAWLGNAAWKLAALGCDYVGPNAYGKQDYAYQIYQYVQHGWDKPKIVLEAGDPGMTVDECVKMVWKLESFGAKAVILFGVLPGFTDDWKPWKKDLAWFRELSAKMAPKAPTAGEINMTPEVTLTTIGGLMVYDRRAEFNGTYPFRDLAGVKYLVQHHSAVDVDSTAEAIDAYHKSLGWPGIGYHFVVHWDGRIEYVGDITRLRYNVASRNHEVVGVLIPGLWMGKQPPSAALDSARQLFAALRKHLRRDLPVVGHKEIALPGHETSCPGDTWEQWKPLVTPASVSAQTGMIQTKMEGEMLGAALPKAEKDMFGYRFAWFSGGFTWWDLVTGKVGVGFPPGLTTDQERKILDEYFKAAGAEGFNPNAATHKVAYRLAKAASRTIEL